MYEFLIIEVMCSLLCIFPAFFTVRVIIGKNIVYSINMKCTIPEISWHNRDPVLSVDVQPKIKGREDFYRLASGGTDSHVLVSYNFQSGTRTAP